MKLALAVAMFAVLSHAVLLQAGDAPRAQPRDFAFTRSLQVKPAPDQHACAVLDANVFAHARPGLDDLRLFAQVDGKPVETPYVVTSSGTTTPGNDPARVLNVGIRNSRVVFDLAMPSRPYSGVDLHLAGQDFLATATVSGLKNINDNAGVALGSYTLFDLSSQSLGSNTALPLQEVSFPFLHVELAVTGVAGRPAPAVTLAGADVPPSREAQTLYTLIAETTRITEDVSPDGRRRSIATFNLPAQVPVERVAFVLDPAFRANFNRSVSVTVKPAGPAPARDDPSEDHSPDQPGLTEEMSGAIARVHLKQGGASLQAPEVSQETLGFPAVIGSGARKPIVVEVAVDNGDDRPLGIHAVRLEMRERQVCFDAQAAALSLVYGDPGLAAPVYDYARTFDASAVTQRVTLGREFEKALAPVSVAPKTFTERHPGLLWAALLAAVAVLGGIAFRSARRVGTPG